MADEVAQVGTVTLAGAHGALVACLADAERLGVSCCAAVGDRAGNLLAFARMDGAPLMSAQIAQDKAYTVAAFGLHTHDWWALLEDDPALLHGIVKTDRLTIFGGGIGITSGDAMVGAVGVSGGSSQQDREIAEAGAAALSPS
ncbi:MAG: cobalamin adenosyltransferase [Pseudonocardia sp.]|nr:cobalamin adenosyltransferase [Pseudonocardia sp.]